jgi:hypothetical protein
MIVWPLVGTTNWEDLKLFQLLQKFIGSDLGWSLTKSNPTK